MLIHNREVNDTMVCNRIQDLRLELKVQLIIDSGNRNYNSWRDKISNIDNE